jgi:protein-tyrosine phosphatase
MGNICRSPVATAMLKQHLPEKEIKSAGLTAMVDEGVEPTAKALAEADGIDVSQHKAQQLTAEHLQWADLILVMSQNQRSLIGNKDPVAMGKTMLLGHWIQATGTRANNGADIPDPYKKSAEVFKHIHVLLLQSTKLWASKI